MVMKSDISSSDLPRCSWCGTDPLYVHYHDAEWGVIQKDDNALFEHLCLEAAQAGLSWLTVLRKRARYREVFFNFEPSLVAKMGARDVKRLLNDAGIIRNRAKIEAVINNANRFIEIQNEFGSFFDYSWSFVGDKPLVNGWRQQKDLPALSDISRAFSKDLKKRGFSFVGPTTIYAHMQAIGMVNDHLVTCFRYDQLAPHRR